MKANTYFIVFALITVALLQTKIWRLNNKIVIADVSKKLWKKGLIYKYYIYIYI